MAEAEQLQIILAHFLYLSLFVMGSDSSLLHGYIDTWMLLYYIFINEIIFKKFTSVPLGVKKLQT